MKMEEKLDKIGEKELKKLDVLTEFWKRLSDDIANATKIKQTEQNTDFDCPKCSQKLLAKNGKFGAFFACPNKECKYTANRSSEGMPIERVKVEKVYSEHPCHLCSNKMLVRKGKLGEFLGCEKYPNCRGMRKTDGSIIEPKAKKPWKNRFQNKKKST